MPTAGTCGTALRCPLCARGHVPLPSSCCSPAQGQVWGRGGPIAPGVGLFLAAGLGGSE